MKTFFRYLILLVASAGLGFGQHTIPATDTVNHFTNQNTFSWIGNTLYAGNSQFPTVPTAITKACSSSFPQQVDIPLGTFSTLVVTSLTGCVNAQIRDDRGPAPIYYTWDTTNNIYIIQSVDTSSFLRATNNLSDVSSTRIAGNNIASFLQEDDNNVQAIASLVLSLSSCDDGDRPWFPASAACLQLAFGNAGVPQSSNGNGLFQPTTPGDLGSLISSLPGCGTHDFLWSPVDGTCIAGGPTGPPGPTGGVSALALGQYTTTNRSIDSANFLNGANLGVGAVRLSDGTLGGGGGWAATNLIPVADKTWFISNLSLYGDGTFGTIFLDANMAVITASGISTNIAANTATAIPSGAVWMRSAHDLTTGPDTTWMIYFGTSSSMPVLTTFQKFGAYDKDEVDAFISTINTSITTLNSGLAATPVQTMTITNLRSVSVLQALGNRIDTTRSTMGTGIFSVTDGGGTAVLGNTVNLAALGAGNVYLPVPIYVGDSAFVIVNADTFADGLPNPTFGAAGAVWYDAKGAILSGDSTSHPKNVAIPVPTGAYYWAPSLCSSSTSFGGPGGGACTGPDLSAVMVYAGASGVSIPTDYVFFPGKDSLPNQLIFPWLDRKWVNFGDSYTAFFGGLWQGTVASQLRIANTTNYAEGGRFLSQQLGPSNYIFSEFMTGTGGTFNPGALAAALNLADLVTIEMTTNDFNQISCCAYPIGTISDTATANTLYGDLENALSKILTANPRTRIVFITPIHLEWLPGATIPGTGQYYTDATAEAGFAAIKAKCAEYGIPVIDELHLSGINKYNFEEVGTSTLLMLQDNIHPSALGFSSFWGPTLAQGLRQIAPQ